jgi:hypothetical protein
MFYNGFGYAPMKLSLEKFCCKPAQSILYNNKIITGWQIANIDTGCC